MPGQLEHVSFVAITPACVCGVACSAPAWPRIQRTASALSLPLAVAQFGGISACSLTASSSLVSWTACSTIAFAAWRYAFVFAAQPLAKKGGPA